MNLEDVVDSKYSGLILVKKGEDTILQKAMGYANLSYSIQNEVDTKFAIASGGESFCCNWNLKINRRGKISL